MTSDGSSYSNSRSRYAKAFTNTIFTSKAQKKGHDRPSFCLLEKTEGESDVLKQTPFPDFFTPHSDIKLVKQLSYASTGNYPQ